MDPGCQPRRARSSCRTRSAGQAPTRRRLGQPDNWFGGSGKYSCVLHGTGGLSNPFRLADGALNHDSPYADDLLIATADERLANLGRDLNLSVEVLVPQDAGGAATEAGPRFRDASGVKPATARVAGYCVTLDSQGTVRVKDSSAGGTFTSVVAASAPPGSFDATTFHALDVRVHANELRVRLDGKPVQFQQNGAPPDALVRLTDVPDQGGSAGLFFGAANNGGVGGQKARNLKIAVYQAFDAGSVPNSGAPPLGPVKPKDKPQ